MEKRLNLSILASGNIGNENNQKTTSLNLGLLKIPMLLLNFQ